MRNRIDLTTPSAVLGWLRTFQNASISTVELQAIQSTITAASVYWLHQCGYLAQTAVPTSSPFNEALSFDEFYDGDDQERLFTRNRPINSVQALIINGVTIPLSTAWNAPGFVIDQSGRSLQIRWGMPGTSVPSLWTAQNQWRTWTTPWTRRNAIRFPVGISNIELQYTAGFPSTAILNELQTIPTSPTALILTTLNPALVNTRIRYFGTGVTLTPVATAPGTGQYVILDIGQYLFAAGDAGVQVLIDYTMAGTPNDVQVAATQMVAINYKRRSTVDQKNAGGIGYRDWELSPEVVRVMRLYQRRAVIL